MNELEQKAFRIIVDFYNKWRSTIIETEEQWDELAADVGRIGEMSGSCPLLFHLLTAALETLNELYKDGRKPVPANYFGRDDL